MANNRYFNWAGYTIGSFTVLVEAGRDKHGSVLWSVHCKECKSIEELSSRVIKEKHKRSIEGVSVSCGCVNPLLKHGMSESPEYTSWRLAKSRCSNSNREDYKFYGGRGIKVCDRWFNSFERFYADLGPRPDEGYSLDRLDVDGNYEPGNCKWSSPLEQANNRRNNHWITYGDRTLTVSQWARKMNLSPSALHYRLEHWAIEQAFNQPVRPYRTAG